MFKPMDKVQWDDGVHIGVINPNQGEVPAEHYSVVDMNGREWILHRKHLSLVPVDGWKSNPFYPKES